MASCCGASGMCLAGGFPVGCIRTSRKIDKQGSIQYLFTHAVPSKCFTKTFKATSALTQYSAIDEIESVTEAISGRLFGTEWNRRSQVTQLVYPGGFKAFLIDI